MAASRIYLDNAATSWPKPESVYHAVDQYQRFCGAAAGRGSYRAAAEANRLVSTARRDLARLLGVADANRIIFTLNCTDALHLALGGILRPGDHVISTVIEHNSVLRPLRQLEQAGKIQFDLAPCNEFGIVDPAAITQLMRPSTRLVVVSHASNVTGAIQPVEDICAVARQAGAFVLVDAAQSCGHLPLAFAKMGAHLVATSGHKGLLGPLGTGLLYVAPGVEEHLVTVRTGGTGTNSETDLQPGDLPHKYESGNLNVPGIVGLGAATQFLQTKSIRAAREHELALLARLLPALRAFPGVSTLGPTEIEARVGLVSVQIAGYDPQEVSALLDAAHGIETRAGLHCAPRMHAALGTLATGGTLRISLGHFTTTDEVDTLIAALAELAADAP